MGNIKFRRAKIEDIKSIQEIEKEYCEGFSLNENILKGWIEKLADNFILAEDKEGRILGFIFAEYLRKPSALPFLHDVSKTHVQYGVYLYVTEIGISDKMGVDLMKDLFKKVVDKAREDKVKFAIWLTGGKGKHDKKELEVLKREGFKKKELVKNWEAYPGFFVSDHSLWIKNI